MSFLKKMRQAREEQARVREEQARVREEQARIQAEAKAIADDLASFQASVVWFVLACFQEGSSFLSFNHPQTSADAQHAALTLGYEKSSHLPSTPSQILNGEKSIIRKALPTSNLLMPPDQQFQSYMSVAQENTMLLSQLIWVLEDRSPELPIVKKLSEYGVAVVDPLLDLLEQPSTIGFAIIPAAVILGNVGKDAIPKLRSRIKDGNYIDGIKAFTIQTAILRALFALEDDVVQRSYKMLLQSGDATLFQVAVNNLGLFGRTPIPVLIRWAAQGDIPAEQIMLVVLGTGEVALQPLKNALMSSNLAVAKTAAIVCAVLFKSMLIGKSKNDTLYRSLMRTVRVFGQSDVYTRMLWPNKIFVLKLLSIVLNLLDDRRTKDVAIQALAVLYDIDDFAKVIDKYGGLPVVIWSLAAVSTPDEIAEEITPASDEAAEEEAPAPDEVAEGVIPASDEAAEEEAPALDEIADEVTSVLEETAEEEASAVDETSTKEEVPAEVAIEEVPPVPGETAEEEAPAVDETPTKEEAPAEVAIEEVPPVPDETAEEEALALDPPEPADVAPSMMVESRQLIKPTSKSEPKRKKVVHPADRPRPQRVKKKRSRRWVWVVLVVVIAVIIGYFVLPKGGMKALRVMEGHTDAVLDVAFSPNGRYALSGSRDNTVRLWDVVNGETIRVMEGHTDSVADVAFSPDGRYALSGSGDFTVRLWDVETGEAVHVLENPTWVGNVAVSSDGKTVLASVGYDILRRWELATGKMLDMMENDVVNTMGHLVFSPDGHSALLTSGNVFYLWNLDTAEITRVFESYYNTPASLAFSSDGHYAIAGTYNGTVHLLDVANNRILRRMEGHTDDVWGVALSPDDRYALSGSGDNTLILWDADTGEELAVMSEHTDTVWDVTFSPDGHYALSGSADGTLRLWDLSELVNEDNNQG